MIRKTYDGVYFKALDDSTGEFEAVVSVFGNVDLQGDRSMPGMFLKSLAKYRDLGNPIPVIWSHDWGDPFAHIGYVDPKDAREILAEEAKSAGFGNITGGLFVKGHLDVDKPFAKQVYDLLKERRVREWSFAYDVNDEGRAKDGANELKEVDLFEVGPTLKGANPATTTIGVKSMLDNAAETERGLKKITWALHVDQDTGMKLLKDWVVEDEKKALSEEVMTELLNTGEKDQSQSQAELRDHLASDHGFMEGGVDLSLDISRLVAIHNILHSGGNISDIPPKADDEVEHKDLATHELAQHLGVDHGFQQGILAGVTMATASALHSELHSALGSPVDDPNPKWFEDVYEKADFKPWHIVEKDGKYCVVKDSDGSEVACHDTREGAVAQLRALYAAEGAASSESADEKSVELVEVAAEAFQYGEKAGRALSSEREQAIRAAIEALTAILPVEGEEVAAAETEKSAEVEQAKAELEEYKRKLELLGL